MDEGYYVNAPSPFIVPGNKYILAILNSKIADWYIRGLGVTRSGGYFEYKPMFVEKLPIPNISNDEADDFINLVEIIREKRFHNESTIELERIIDDLAYDIYGLTPDEKKYIESID